jgi:prophage DNA circulation protein
LWRQVSTATELKSGQNSLDVVFEADAANGGLAMEDAEVVAGGEGPIEDTPIEEVIESSDVEADPVEEGVDEIEEAAEETEEAVDQIETSEEVVEALESIYASMESAMADGGLTAREAGFANAAIAAQLKRLRVASPIKMSTESFVSLEDRKANTELSMEGLKEVGKKVVDAIRAALQADVAALTNELLSATDDDEDFEKDDEDDTVNTDYQSFRIRTPIDTVG